MSNNNKLADKSFSELMTELSQLEVEIEQRELDDLDKLMSEVEQAEAIIVELRKRLKKAEQKIADAEED